jgi:hypothetical protein
VPALGHAVEHWAQGLTFGGALMSNLAGGVTGFVAGVAMVGVMQGVNRLRA